MSLSKLGSTSSGSSQIAFDGKKSFSKKQLQKLHPLLQPTILDNIFSYLNFPELKSNRLVCKSWSEVGIPFIGRRKLKPVKYSRISHEDFQTLKQEFIKSPNKVKLFQGFQLQWDEMSDMISNNFLTSFNPSQLVISGEDIIDPSTELNNLLQPVLTTLNDLSLEIHENPASISALLNILAPLRPMILKRLILIFEIRAKEGVLTYQEVDDIFRGYEGVFQRQSSTLEELQLIFNCKVSYDRNGNFNLLQLPVFHRLQHLNLALELTKSDNPNSYFHTLGEIDFCINFPKLIQLKILDSTLYTMRNIYTDITLPLTSGHPLKKLDISNENPDSQFEDADMYQKLYMSFPFVEELTFRHTSLLHLKHGGIELLWVDTLRTLKAGGSLQFNLGHLKKLEHIHYIAYKCIDEFPDPWITSFTETLLKHHRQLVHLKRLHLTYTDMDFIDSENMDQIQEGIPEELRAILTIDDDR